MSVIDRIPELSALALREVIAQTELKFEELPDGTVAIPFKPDRAAGPIVVQARRLDELVVFAVGLPQPRWLAEGEAMRSALRLSLQADFVKAFVLPSGTFVLACELPSAAVTPGVADGLVRGLAALADVKKADLTDEAGWQRQLATCATIHSLSIPDTAATEREALRRLALQAEFPVSGGDGQPMTVRIDIAGAELTLVVPPTRRVVSLIAPFGDCKPKTKEQLRGLLELNRLANVAKLGLDADGDVALLYEVPHVTPDLFERLIPQFAVLLLGVSSLGIGR